MLIDYNQSVAFDVDALKFHLHSNTNEQRMKINLTFEKFDCIRTLNLLEGINEKIEINFH